MAQKQYKLWTKDFTIITLGSIVSMLGGAMSGFAMSLFVLDYTGNATLYAVYVFLYTMPQIIAPIIAGPLMDRFSRRRTIYTLDFLTTVLYLSMGLLVVFGYYSFGVLAAMTFVLGCISSTYQVAFTSFYPMLITEGNYRKAYSIQTTLETMTYVMIPLSTLLYNSFGLGTLLIINSAFFFVAAVCETRISDVEAYCGHHDRKYTASSYLSDAKQGFKYLFADKGLLLIAVYFTFSAFGDGSASVIQLPFFKARYADGYSLFGTLNIGAEYLYVIVLGTAMIGRLIGGLLNYKIAIKQKAKYITALIIYVAINIMQGVTLFTPVLCMCILCFFTGLFASTSYNIRVSATQSYVPNEMKGRFNGAFIMLNTTGALIGEVAAGGLNSILPMEVTNAVFMGVCTLAAIVIIGGGKHHISPIYNRET